MARSISILALVSISALSACDKLHHAGVYTNDPRFTPPDMQAPDMAAEQFEVLSTDYSKSFLPFLPAITRSQGSDLPADAEKAQYLLDLRRITKLDEDCRPIKREPVRYRGSRFAMAEVSPLNKKAAIYCVHSNAGPSLLFPPPEPPMFRQGR